MGTFTASSPYKKISTLVLEDGTHIDIQKNVLQSEFVPGQVWSSGGHFLITIAISPADFKKLIKDTDNEDPK